MRMRSIANLVARIRQACAGHRSNGHGWRIAGRCAGASLIVILASACTSVPRYNSLDLALLPCESGDSPVFFRALEFDEGGVPTHAQQLDDLRKRLDSGPPVTDFVVFAHGWNKNPSSAELDFQNFLCRLHGRLRNIIGDDKRAGGLLVLGIFWPSTVTNRPREPLLVKPVSYYRIRDRADVVAEEGLAKLLADLRPALERNGRPSMHLIGHSFGGRMMIRSLEVLQERGELVPFLTAADPVNVVLINGALAPSRFDWIGEAVAKALQQRARARFTESTASYLFNIHSFHDSANRYLFPLASLFNDEPSECAAGACGVPAYPTLCVDESGKVVLDPTRPGDRVDATDRLNAWNVDATRIVFDHSDIYKGRLATLIADLLYDAKTRQRFPAGSGEADAAPGARCESQAAR